MHGCGAIVHFRAQAKLARTGRLTPGPHASSPRLSCSLPPTPQLASIPIVNPNSTCASAYNTCPEQAPALDLQLYLTLGLALALAQAQPIHLPQAQTVAIA